MKRKSPALSAVVLMFVLATTAWGQRPPDIPSGTTIRIRMIDKLSSEESAMGDVFHATLDEPVNVNGKDVYPRGADVTGRVAVVHKTGRLSEPGELDLVLNTVSSGNLTSYLHVDPMVIKGESHTKSNATKIGGGAALGAIIGAIAGGGKGAAIGTVAGGAAGTGAAAATGKKPALVESEAVLSFTTTGSSSTVAGNAPVKTGDSPADRDRPVLEHRPATAEAPAPDSARLKPESAQPAPDSAEPKPESTQPAPPTASDNAGPLFTLRDRRIIRTCVDEHASDFPADLLKRPELPSGSERDIRGGGTLPAEAQKKARSLPLDCVRQLPPVPSEMDRVLYNGRVLLIDSKDHILDMFSLEDNEQ